MAPRTRGRAGGPSPEKSEAEPLIDHVFRPVDVAQVGATAHQAKGEYQGEKRKLTKKAKESLEKWQGGQRSATRDSFFKGLAASSRSKFGDDSVFFGAEAGKNLIGLPVPSLAIEYLIGMSSMPINIFLLITGDTDSRKSTFLYEMFRWFTSLDGGIWLAECETKYNEMWARTIGGYQNDDYPVICRPCDTQQEQQDFITFALQETKRMMLGTAEEPGPGRTLPTMFAIDSLTGKFSQERHDQIEEEGHASRNYSTEALHMGPFVSNVMSQTKSWPFMFAAISHVSRSEDPRTHRVVRSKRGGIFKDYQQGLEIELSHAKALDYRSFEGYEMNMKTYKNSYAPKLRQIRSRVTWWEAKIGENEDGSPITQQQAAWDWDWATARLMCDMPSKRRSMLKELAGISFDFQTPENDLTPRIKCKGYDICGGEFVHFREFGRAVRQDPKFTNIMRAALGVRNVPVLNGDYGKQLEEQRETAE